MSNETQRRDIVEHHLSIFAKALADHMLDGWAIDKGNPGTQAGLYGGSFTISLYRNADTVQAMKDKALGLQDIAKPTRADILAKARAAKAANKR